MPDKDNLAASAIWNLAYDETGEYLRVFLIGGSAGAPPAAIALRAEQTGSGAIALTTAFAVKMRIKSVRGHASAAVVEALIITFDSKTDAAYDAKEQEVSPGWTDFKWQPDGDDLLEAGDELVIACANSGSATFGVTVIAEEVN